MHPRRQATFRALSPEQLRAVSDGRARVTRSGRLVAIAPHWDGRESSTHGLDANPNRGKRNAAPNGSRVAEPRTDSPYAPLTVSWPTRDSRGHRNPRIAGNVARGRIGYTI